MEYNINKKKTKKGLRIYFKKNKKIISPLHDIPHGFYESNKELYINMIVEIPKFTKRKMEISMDEKHNPIKQDIKNNKLRNVAEIKNRPTKKNNKTNYNLMYNLWGNKEGYNLFSYGAVPQTYENPEENLKEYKNYSFYSELLNTKIDSHKVINSDNKTFLKELLQKKKIIKSNKLNPNNIYGDGDPLDIFLIHDDTIKFKIGSIIKVKILGIIPMIDDGEIDWKILSVLPDDNKDYKNHYKKYINWFKYYKSKYYSKDNFFDKGKVIFGNNNKIMNQNVARIVINKCLEHYKKKYNK